MYKITSVLILLFFSLQFANASDTQQNIEEIKSLEGVTYYIVTDDKGIEQLKRSKAPHAPALACGTEFIDLHRANRVVEDYESRINPFAIAKHLGGELLDKLRPSCDKLEGQLKRTCDLKAKTYNASRDNLKLHTLALEIAGLYDEAFHECQSKVVPITEDNSFSHDVDVSI